MIDGVEIVSYRIVYFEDVAVLRIKQVEKLVVVHVQIDHDLVDDQTVHQIVFYQLAELVALLFQALLAHFVASLLQDSLQGFSHDEWLRELAVDYLLMDSAK